MQLLLLFLASALAHRTHQHYSMELAVDYFQDFITTYDKHYKDEAEKTNRFEIFKQNLKMINKKNSESNHAVFGINKFSDLTKEEFIKMYTGLRGDMLREASNCKEGSVNSTIPPDSWDWKEKGVVSKAKDQNLCGSCWAFSAIGNVEAQYAIKHKDILDLSEQQLVDCDKQSNGCEGTRTIEIPFLYLVEAKGSMLEKDYPYTHVQSECQYDQSKVKVSVTDCRAFSPKTEDELKNTLYNVGPLSIAVDASDMQAYQNGVLKSCSYEQLNHAVLLVGYGTEKNTPYWLIKNSWGELYGENGFIKIERGVDACGIMTDKALQSIVN